MMAGNEMRQDRESKLNKGKKGGINYFDYSLLFVVIFLIFFGCLMVYSASSYSAVIEKNDSMYYLNRHIAYVFFGAIAMIFFICIDYRIWARKLGKLIPFAYIFSLVVVVGVKVPGLGLTLNGASRWIKLGPFTFQPAEFVKFTTILIIAYIIYVNYERINELLVALHLFTFLAAAWVGFITSNFSSMLIIEGIGVVMILIAVKNFKPTMCLIVVGIVAAGAYLLLAGGFRASRIQVWLNPEAYSRKGGYQVMQGLYAIGSGGFFGKGLGQSVQKLGGIPEAQNDYIFTIICEEFGIVGAVAVICLFAFILWRMRVIAANAPDIFGSMIVVGVMAQIAIQVIGNVAVVTNTVPNTGISLPFISYGGTSLLFLMIEVGMVLSVSKRIKRVR